MEDPAKKPVDIANLGIKDAAEKPGEMTVVSPFDGEPIGAILEVLGYDSDTVREAHKEFSRLPMTPKPGQRVDPDAVLERRRVYIAQRAVVGGRGFVFNGKEVPIPSDEFRRIMEMPNFSWLSQQIDRFGTNRGNFNPATRGG